MKQIFTMLLTLTLLGMGVNDLQAQNSPAITSLLEQVDTTKRDTFKHNLEVLLDDLDIQDFQLEGVIDSFFKLDINGNTLIFGDQAFPFEWDINNLNLNEFLRNSGFSTADSLELGDQFEAVNEVWNNNLDTLGSSFDLFDGPIEFNPNAVQEGQDRYDQFSGLRRQSIHILQRRLNRELGATEPGEIGNLGGLLDNAFSSLFNLELAFGKETAAITYYREQSEKVANVIRVGSVPEFDRTWEAQWHLQGAFLRGNQQTLDENIVLEENAEILRLGGNFSCMFNPGLGRLRAGGRFRLYTSLGIEFDTYVPAHIDPLNKATIDNVGKTTGYGPQIGSGFIVGTPLATFYTYGTLSYGGVSKSPGYKYEARAVHAGVRFGHVANIRYEQGKASWAPNDRKAISYSRITVGILLTELFRK